MKKCMAWILALGVCLLSAACGKAGAGSDASAGAATAAKTPAATTAAAAGASSETTAAASTAAAENREIVMPVSADISDINAHLYKGSMIAQGMVFEGLVVYNKGKIEPALAEKWDISEDGKTYTFHLRKGVAFTDGEPFNAEAVKANIEAVLDNAERHSWLVSTTKIQSVEVADEYTVTFNLSDPYYPLLTEMTLIRPYRMMSPKSFVDGGTKDGVAYLAGTGAYTLAEKVDDQYAVFKANEQYWGGKPAFDKVTLKVMPAGETTQLAFQNGELNFLFGTYMTGMVDPEVVQAFEQDSRYQVKYSEPISSRYLLVNCSPASVTSDLNIRKAIWQSIDKAGLCSGVFSGLDMPAETLFADSMPYCGVKLPARPYDTKAARALIEQSGWQMDSASGFYQKDGVNLKVRLLYNSSAASNKTVCEFIQANLKDAGIQAELMPAEKTTLYDIRTAGDFDVILDATWGTPYDPQNCITGILSKTSYAPAVEALDGYQSLCDDINAVMISVDESERQALWSKILTSVHEDSAFIPLSYTRLSIVTAADMQNVVFGDTQYDVPFYKYK